MTSLSAWDSAGPDSLKFRRTYRRLVENTTINTTTFLSTDYLNHFNELIMMIDLIPDMPEMLSEAMEWRPKTYAEHFQASAFTHKDLAIAAYDHVLALDRQALESTVAAINQEVDGAFKVLPPMVNTGDPDILREYCATKSRRLQTLIDRCSGIINGVEGAADLALSAPLDHEPEPDTAASDSEEEAVVMDQSAIDALFD